MRSLSLATALMVAAAAPLAAQTPFQPDSAALAAKAAAGAFLVHWVSPEPQGGGQSIFFKNISADRVITVTRWRIYDCQNIASRVCRSHDSGPEIKPGKTVRLAWIEPRTMSLAYSYQYDFDVRWRDPRSLDLPANTNIAASPADPGANIISLGGNTIEVLGLERWTVPMLRDSLAAHDPTATLDTRAADLVLQDQLHFAQVAAVTYLADPAGAAQYVVLSLVEPQDSARIRYREMPLDTTGGRAEWREMTDLIRRHPSTLFLTIGLYGSHGQRELEPTIPPFALRDSATIVELWDQLRTHRSLADGTRARETLLADPNVYDRMAAAAVLGNFAANDSTWWAVVAAMREREGGARDAADATLYTLGNTVSHDVDWAPAAADLHALLDGTNLPQLTMVMTQLSATGVGPALAKPLLQGGGHGVLMYAAARQPIVHAVAIRFLRLVSGKDLGDDVGKWQAWIEGL